MQASVSRAFDGGRAAVTFELEATNTEDARDLVRGLLDVIGLVLCELAMGRCPRCSCEAFCDCAEPCKLCALRAQVQSGSRHG